MTSSNLQIRVVNDHAEVLCFNQDDALAILDALRIGGFKLDDHPSLTAIAKGELAEPCVLTQSDASAFSEALEKYCLGMVGHPEYEDDDLIDNIQLFSAASNSIYWTSSATEPTGEELRLRAGIEQRDA